MPRNGENTFTTTPGAKRKNFFAHPILDRLRCPKCKSDNIGFYSRPKYLIKAAVCASLVILCFFALKTIVEADEGGLTAFMGIFVIFGPTFLISLMCNPPLVRTGIL